MMLFVIAVMLASIGYGIGTGFNNIHHDLQNITRTLEHLADKP
jgi:hypothetical protein